MKRSFVLLCGVLALLLSTSQVLYADTGGDKPRTFSEDQPSAGKMNMGHKDVSAGTESHPLKVKSNLQGDISPTTVAPTAKPGSLFSVPAGKKKDQEEAKPKKKGEEAHPTRIKEKVVGKPEQPPKPTEETHPVKVKSGVTGQPDKKKGQAPAAQQDETHPTRVKSELVGNPDKKKDTPSDPPVESHPTRVKSELVGQPDKKDAEPPVEKQSVKLTTQMEGQDKPRQQQEAHPVKLSSEMVGGPEPKKKPEQVETHPVKVKSELVGLPKPREGVDLVDPTTDKPPVQQEGNEGSGLVESTDKKPASTAPKPGLVEEAGSTQPASKGNRPLWSKVRSKTRMLRIEYPDGRVLIIPQVDE